MKRRFPPSLWLGLLVVLAAPLLYGLLFIRFPITRDVPWVTLLLFAFGLGLLVHALRQARRDGARYRGKVAAPIALTLGVVLAGFFSYAFFVGARDLPESKGAPRVGDHAPDFTLPDQDGKPVSLAELLAPGPADRAGGVLLVFYRGHW